ncbi:hypothetical protein M422DRAFT_256552 [Sphaerobolus stellatus SS14]|uniref:Uncharacterized protein n=1 Tax=Sphaerobolus stellatus (strain SS14) TaxID=990650 RepID=A0A0C9VQQ0_SPHS4|nr:hypothetical protein M422DRAFT_256552 [Sphaerobolus stellatus SS14]
MTRSTCVTDQLAQLASERGTSEDPTQTPNPHGGSGHPLLPKTYSDYSGPSERSASADPDPEELALGDQIQEMLNTINKHMDEVKTIHNMSRQVAQLLTAILEQLYADQAPEGHLNQAAMAARNIHMEYERILRLSKAGLLNPQDQQQSIPPSKNPRIKERRENPCKSVHYAPFDGIEDNNTDSETTVRNHQEGFVPFQHLDDRDILDISNNEGDNPLIRMVKYMLDQNINTTMEKPPLAKAGVKVTPPPPTNIVGNRASKLLRPLSKASYDG